MDVSHAEWTTQSRHGKMMREQIFDASVNTERRATERALGGLHSVENIKRFERRGEF
jgi:hypothetical protein